MGLRGRSVSLETRISLSLERPSLLMNPPLQDYKSCVNILIQQFAQKHHDSVARQQTRFQKAYAQKSTMPLHSKTPIVQGAQQGDMAAEGKCKSGRLESRLVMLT